MRALLQPSENGCTQIEEIVPYEHIWERVLLELEQIEKEGVFVKEYRGPSAKAEKRDVKTQDSQLRTQTVN